MLVCQKRAALSRIPQVVGAVYTWRGPRGVSKSLGFALVIVVAESSAVTIQNCCCVLLNSANECVMLMSAHYSPQGNLNHVRTLTMLESVLPLCAGPGYSVGSGIMVSRMSAMMLTPTPLAAAHCRRTEKGGLGVWTK